MKRNTTIRDRHRATIARAQPPCWICGKPISYDLKYPDAGCYVVDHVVPLDRGGEDALSNKRAAHRRPKLQQREVQQDDPEQDQTIRRPPAALMKEPRCLLKTGPGRSRTG